ncbi:MAG: Uma2 family endonuclease, partial [Thermotogae bacterium]|nr:Uma2 family endonuclease [Thermotogota bacterium]
DVPPALIVEIDVRAEVESEMEYVWEKSEQLLNSGVEKVVWIFTKPRKVFVFEKGKRPTIYDWDEEVELLEDVKVRLSDLLK